jgi:hypothetical protein
MKHSPYWILASREEYFGRKYSAEETLRVMLGQGTWLLPRKKQTLDRLDSMHAGHRVCFHVSQQGVMAAATVAADPDRIVNGAPLPPGVRLTDSLIPISFRDVRWLPRPVLLSDLPVRSSLDAFKGKDLSNPWSWILRQPSRITEHDFHVLTKS